MFVIGSIPCLCNEVEIDDQYDKQIHRPGDDGIEHLPVGIGFVVLPAPASVGNQSPQRYQKQDYRQGYEPCVPHDGAEGGKPGFDEGYQLDIFQADNRLAFLFHNVAIKS